MRCVSVAQLRMSAETLSALSVSVVCHLRIASSVLGMSYSSKRLHSSVALVTTIVSSHECNMSGCGCQTSSGLHGHSGLLLCSCKRISRHQRKKLLELCLHTSCRPQYLNHSDPHPHNVLLR